MTNQVKNHGEQAPLAEPTVDTRWAVYDTTETGKPFLELRQEIIRFLTELMETLDRDPDPVVNPLVQDVSWWVRVGTQEYLAAVHVATSEDAILRLNVDYDFDTEEDLSVPSPDVLPLVADEDQLTVSLVFDTSRPVTPEVRVPKSNNEYVTFESRTIEKVDPENRDRATITSVGDDGPAPSADSRGDQSRYNDDPDSKNDPEPGGDSGGKVSVTVAGPKGQKHSIRMAPDAKIGKLVATLVQEIDGVAAIDLTHDEAGRDSVDSDVPAAEFDGKQLYWKPIDRAGGSD